MAKDKPQEITRRDFIGVAIGSAFVAGIGCSDTSAPGSESGASGGATGDAQTSTTGQGGQKATSSGSKKQTGGATSDSTKSAQGGDEPASSPPDTEQGGTSSDSSAEGGSKPGSTQSKGGASANGGASSGKGGSSSGKGGSSAKSSASDKGGTSGQGGTSAKGGSSASSGGTPSSSTTTSAGATPVVAMVRGTDWAQATEDAIEKVGGLPDLTGKTVVIRPNVIDSKADGTTSPEVIRGVIRAAKKKGAKEILVAEDGFGGAVIGFMDTLGISAVCKEEGATATELKNSPSTNEKPSQAAAWSNGLDFYNTVKNADYVINVPKCKTHGLATVSMALKAWFGCIKRPSSADLHSSVHNKAAEAHLVRQEDFVVMDATRCMTTGGPSAGTMKDSKIVVASKDAIAADVTGIAIIRYNGGMANTSPWDVGQIKRALALKFPGWLSAKTDFAYEAVGISEHAEIMAKRN